MPHPTSIRSHRSDRLALSLAAMLVGARAAPADATELIQNTAAAYKTGGSAFGGDLSKAFLFTTGSTAFDFGSIAKVKLNDKTSEKASSGRTIVFDAVRFVPASPSIASKPKTVEPKVVGEPGLPGAQKLRLYPKAVTAVPGARKLVSAWTCPADDRSPFGPDREPGTKDDDCDPVEADWRLRDEETARLNKRTGHKVLVQLATEADNRVIATYGELRQGTPITWQPRPAGKPMPPLMPPFVAEE